MSDDRPLSRVRRAKSRQSPSARVDSGAVAVGMVVTLGAHLIPAFFLLFETSASLVRVTALASTLTFPLGSYVTGRYAGGDWERCGLHGLLTATASLVLLGMLAVVLVGPGRAVGEFGRILVAESGLSLISGSPLLAATVVFLLFTGIIGGALGSN
ncbi:hypothetical protein [Haladaptatus sp. DFWS20]|uniref:hypothetical protein n=1 Tax=Haladaptatus sp. DFWS20 TaxID=3403467 RepID=UPI003EBD2E20